LNRGPDAGEVMDTRYRERGYAVELVEEAYGAFLTISRNGRIVGEVAVGIFSGGPDTPVQVAVKRFRPHELQKVTVDDDFEEDG
jgi:hypothetical protein